MEHSIVSSTNAVTNASSIQSAILSAKPDRSQTTVFTFPQADQVQFEQIRDIDHFRQLLVNSKSQLSKYYLRTERLFRITYLSDGKFIQARCASKRCPGRLRYQKKQSNGKYQMIQSSRVHTHFQTQANTNLVIQNFIRQYEGKLQQISLRKLVERTFGITASQYYYQYKRLMEEECGKGFATIATNLKQQGFLVESVPDQLTDQEFDIPDMIIVVSQDMKQAYEKYGQFMTFDVTYNLVKQRRMEVDEGGEERIYKWGLGLMMGKNNHNKIVPFGVVITNTQTVDAFKYMFAVFFKMMEKPPQVIISDQQITIGAALKALKDQGYWQGVHLLDTFHLLRNIRFNLAQKNSYKSANKDVFTHLRKAVAATTQDQYELGIMCAKSCAKNELQKRIVQDFIKHAHRYCISQTSPAFSGITISTSFAEATNGFIKRIIIDQRRCTQVLIKVVKILQELIEKSHQFQLSPVNYADIFDNPQIRIIQNSLCAKIMKAFMDRYIRCLPLQYNILSDDNYSFQDRQKVYNVIRRAQTSNQGQQWSCGCQQMKKTGLPCIHIMKIILITNRDTLASYIHQRWIITPQPIQKTDFERRCLPRKRGKLTRLQKDIAHNKIGLINSNQTTNGANINDIDRPYRYQRKDIYDMPLKRGRKKKEDIDV